jgi:hypothetical protein
VLTWLAILEQTPLSVWMRESPSLLAFPFVLYLHTLGLAMLAGLSVGLDCWVLAARTWPQRLSLIGLYRTMWLGFGINAVSGIVLLIAYPAKALTNWVFFAKLLLVVGAVIVLERMRSEATTALAADGTVSTRARRLAALSLLFWTGTILAGRLLAYTHSILLVSDGYL